jgi:hypothetical protein
VGTNARLLVVDGPSLTSILYGHDSSMGLRRRGEGAEREDLSEARIVILLIFFDRNPSEYFPSKAIDDLVFVILCGIGQDRQTERQAESEEKRYNEQEACLSYEPQRWQLIAVSLIRHLP